MSLGTVVIWAAAIAGHLASAGDDHLAKLVGTRRNGSGIPLAASTGALLGTGRRRRLTVITRTAMPWIQLKITTTVQQVNTLSEALTESGAVSVTFQDTHDVPVYEPLPGRACRAIGLYDAATDMATVLEVLKTHPLLGANFTYKIEKL